MRSTVKSALNTLCGLIVAPAVAFFQLQSYCGDRNQSFAGWTQLFSLIPGRTGVLLRHAFLRQTCSGCQQDAHVGFGTIFSHAGVSIGQTSYIGHYCSIGEVAIEDDVLIASNVSIMNGCHQHGTSRMDIPIREQPGVYENITIGSNSWIGERATIAANVGRHCIIGAGSLVVKPIPDYSIAVGSPARIIRDRRQMSDSSGADDTATTAELEQPDRIPETVVQTAEFALDCLTRVN